MSGARQREGCGYVRLHGNCLLRPSQGGSAIGAGRHAMAGALVEWFRRNGTEKGWSDRARSCMVEWAEEGMVVSVLSVETTLYMR